MRFDGGNVTRECIVRDISMTGARLEVDRAASIPKEFYLNIPQRGSLMKCELVWRADARAGIRFLNSDLEATDDTLEGARAKITKLEEEIASLKLEVGRLTALLAID